MGYEDQRAALARRVREALAGELGPGASLRALAGAAGTSVATLKHYFGDRDGLLQGVMESARADAAPYLAMAAQVRPGDVRGSLQHFLRGLCRAWTRHGVGPMYGATLALGLGSRAVGPSFVSHVLEPLLQAGEALLRQLEEQGALTLPDVRAASLALLAPVVFALLHQDNLAGARCRPLDLPRFLEAHVDAFLRSFQPRGRR